MSHSQILNLLHREANQMSGYGMCSECPSCAGSGLIGGFAGQKAIYGAINDAKLTKAERDYQKKLIFDSLATDREKARRRKKTKAEKLEEARDFVARGGAPKPSTKGLAAKQAIARAQEILAANPYIAAQLAQMPSQLSASPEIAAILAEYL